LSLPNLPRKVSWVDDIAAAKQTRQNFRSSMKMADAAFVGIQSRHAQPPGSVMVRVAHSLKAQLDLYGTQSAWQRDDVKAMDCRDCEQVIAFGNYLFSQIRRIDQCCQAGAVPSEEDARAVQKLYEDWAQFAKGNLECAAAIEQKGYKIDGVEQFRAAYHEARSVLSIPVDRVRSAMKNADEGRTRPMREVRDALRHRMDA
jgi:hypothetical protein